MAKALIVLDYVKADYFNRKQELDFEHSSVGRQFINVLTYYGLKQGIDYDFAYFYPNIPRVNKMDKYKQRVVSYKPLLKADYEQSVEHIDKIATNYDIIVPTGAYGLKHFYGHDEDKPNMWRVMAHDKYDNGKLILPIYSQEVVDADLEKAMPRNLAVRKLVKYISGEWQLNTPRVGNYKLVTTIDELKQVLHQAVRNTCAWDTETSSLNPNNKDSRILCMTLSFKTGEGYFIPLSHRQSPFHGDTLDEVKKLLKAFLDFDSLKVAHNGRYDLTWTLARGLSTKADTVVDTKIGYWLLVDQEVKENLRLTDLSWLLTPMGGYDDPLEEFKGWLLDVVGKLMYTSAKSQAKAEKAKVADIKLADKSIHAVYDTLCSPGDDPLFKQLTKKQQEDLLALHNQMMLQPFMTDEVLGDAVNIIGTAYFHYHTEANVKRHFSYDWIPLAVMVNYAVGDVDSCRQIFLWEQAEMNKANPRLQYLFYNFYPKFIYTLARIQYYGAYIDTDYTKRLQAAYDKHAQELLDELRQFPDVKELATTKQQMYLEGVKEMAKDPADRDKDVVKYRTTYKDPDSRLFNPASTADKQHLLFDILGLHGPSKTPGGKKLNPRATGKDMLNYLQKDLPTDSDAYQIINKLLEFTKVNKLKSSFADTMLGDVSDKDHCVHAVFNETGTSTSRLSSSHPNLQNQSSHTGGYGTFTYKYPIKRQFTSRFKGGIVLNCDYSNLELRVLGLLSGDHHLLHVFASGEDIHRAVAADAFHVPYDEVKDDQRQAAKRINFGLSYGITAAGLADQIGCTPEQAKEFMTAYFKSKPEVKKFFDRVEATGLQQGYVETMQGFRRQLYEAFSKSKNLQQAAVRKCGNTAIQGTSAFLTNSSLIECIKYFDKIGAKSSVALTVHDSIFVDVAPDEIETVVPAVKHIMTHLPIDWLTIEKDGKPYRYPIDAELAIGYDYADLVDFDMDDFKTFKTVYGYLDYYGAKQIIHDKADADIINADEKAQAVKELEAKKPLYQAVLQRNGEKFTK